MQFSVAVEEFLRFCAIERQLSAHTVQAYTADLNDFGKWLGSDAVLSELTTAALKDYLEHLTGARRRSVATIRRRFACLRAFFRRATDHGWTADPFAKWRPLLPRRKRLPRALSRLEAVHLLTSCARGQSRMQATGSLGTIIRLMIATGMRVGELCRLQMEDVSPDCTTLRLHGKGARDRIAYVTDPELRCDLQRYLDWRRGSALPSRCLFVNSRGAPLRPQSVRTRLRRSANGAGLSRRVTPHMLRHTAATLLIETGVDIRFVQRLLGHSSIATTEIYTHVSDEALRTTIARADVLAGLESG